MDKLFKINQKGKLFTPKPIRNIIHEIDQQNISNNLKTLLNIEVVKTNYIEQSGNANIHIDIVAITDQNEPVFIYFASDINTNIIEKSIYQHGVLDAYKDSLRSIYNIHFGNNGRNIKWADTRSICIATSFSQQQLYLLSVVSTPVSLYSYNVLEHNYVLFSKVITEKQHPAPMTLTPPKPSPVKRRTGTSRNTGREVFTEAINSLDPAGKRLYNTIVDRLEQLSPDVDVKIMMRNATVTHKSMSASIIAKSSKNIFKIHLKINTDGIVFDNVTVRDISQTRYSGTVELIIRSTADYERVEHLIKEGLGL